jgi:hypothetical protein
MGNLWVWFDGKKSVLGASALWIALFIQDFVIGQLGVVSPFLPGLIDFLNYIGQILLPVGIMHKAAKAIPPTTPK